MLMLHPGNVVWLSFYDNSTIAAAASTRYVIIAAPWSPSSQVAPKEVPPNIRNYTLVRMSNILYTALPLPQGMQVLPPAFQLLTKDYQLYLPFITLLQLSQFQVQMDVRKFSYRLPVPLLACVMRVRIVLIVLSPMKSSIASLELFLPTLGRDCA